MWPAETEQDRSGTRHQRGQQSERMRNTAAQQKSTFCHCTMRGCSARHPHRQPRSSHRQQQAPAPASPPGPATAEAECTSASSHARDLDTSVARAGDGVECGWGGLLELLRLNLVSLAGNGSLLQLSLTARMRRTEPGPAAQGAGPLHHPAGHEHTRMVGRARTSSDRSLSRLRFSISGPSMGALCCSA